MQKFLKIAKRKMETAQICHVSCCFESLDYLQFVSSERGRQFVYSLFRRSSNRAEESDEMSYMKELTSVSEPTQIQLGLL